MFEVDDDAADAEAERGAQRCRLPVGRRLRDRAGALPRPDAARRAALTEPLALLYRHLDADDLEDADELLDEIESLEPPADLTEAVEDLVRATLLLADVGRPR